MKNHFKKEDKQLKVGMILLLAAIAAAGITLQAIL